MTLQVGRVVFITDSGANVVAALRGYTRLNCNAHILSITLSSTFAPDMWPKTPELSELLTNGKKSAKYFKHSSLQNISKKSLKQSIKNWWNSNYDMLDSILQQHEEISTLLVTSNQCERIAQINANTLKTWSVSQVIQGCYEWPQIRQFHFKRVTSTAIRLTEHCKTASIDPNVCADVLLVPKTPPRDVQDYNASDS